MTQVIYIVTFKSANPRMNDIYGGVWGAYTTFNKATEKVENWIIEYKETILDYEEQANGLYMYFTDKGTWIIEPTPLDD